MRKALMQPCVQLSNRLRWAEVYAAVALINGVLVGLFKPGTVSGRHSRRGVFGQL
jgi:hypothetical protein